MNASVEYLFVYGTLMQTVESPHRLILETDGSYVGKGRFQGKLFMVENYPGVVPSGNPSDQVTGELYVLKNTTDVFRKLDVYEGYNTDNPDSSLYKREKRDIFIPGTGASVSSWIYLYNRTTQGLPVIRSGDFLEYLGKT